MGLLDELYPGLTAGAGATPIDDAPDTPPPPAYAGPEDWTAKTGLWGTDDKPERPWGTMDGVEGLALHYTGDRHSQEQSIDDIKEKGYGPTFRMDRDGNVVRLAPDDALMQHTKNGRGATEGYGNNNLHGLEVAAKDNNDLTDAQRAAIPQFVAWHAAQNGYDPTKTVFGHGELDPRRKSGEMVDVAQAIRNGEPLPVGEALTTKAALGGPKSSMPETDDTGTEKKPRGLLQRIADAVDEQWRRPGFAAGAAILGSPPNVMGGSWGTAGVNAANQTAQQGIALDEHANVMQQRANRQKIWNTQLFPGGQPNFNHPLLKDTPPELVQAALAGGPDEGLPLLQKYTLASAEQKLQIQMQLRHAQMVGDIFKSRGLGSQGQAPAASPQAPPPQAFAPGQPPLMTPPPGAQPPNVPPGISVQSPGQQQMLQAPQPVPQSAPPPQPQSARPQASPGFIPPGMPDRVPGLAERNQTIGDSVLGDRNLQDAVMLDMLIGDKTGRGASTLINQALIRAQQPEIAGKSAYMTARGKAEGERAAANIQMQVPLAIMEHLEDKIRHTPKELLNAATGPFMGDNAAQAYKSMLVPTKHQAEVYNLNLEMHHVIDTLQKALKQGGATDQDQAIAGKAMGRFMNVKNDPDKMLDIINDAKNMIRTAGGEMPKYLVDKYKDAPDYKRGGPATSAPPGYKIRLISPPPAAQP